MTIDKSVDSPAVFNGTSGTVSEQEALKTLKDFFPDAYQESVLLKALQAGKIGTKYNVELCINWLLDQQTSAVSKQTRSGSGFASDSVGPSESRSATTAVVPASAPKVLRSGAKDVDDDLQKAIQNSMREQGGPAGLGGQISAEEQEISRVIEASIASSKTRDLRQSTLFFTDPPNPHERERLGVWPIGLKNVGNTCWFSVVVQALFHLPTFRQFIYDLNLTNLTPNDAQTSSASNSTKELEFMLELRRLFALLLASKRKYVDPSNVVEVLRKQESLQLRNGGVDNQQDVSEFTHLVLEWIEEAFNIVCKRKIAATAAEEKDANANSTTSTATETHTDTNLNPIQQLFYGSFLIESRSSDSSSLKEDRFSQYPLHVASYDNLHDSFEASMCQCEHDEVTQTTTVVEHWLNKSPPILLFELSRFRFNQGDNKPEKIHSRFVFPQTLYIDRYEKYGSLTSSIPLSDVLKSVMEFANAVKCISNSNPDLMDVNMDSPRVTSDEELNKPMDTADTVIAELAGTTTVMSMDFEDSTLNESSYEVLEPRPKFASADELKNLNQCLTRWSREVDENVDELKSKIDEIENSINEVYQEDCMKKRAYVLHGVLVHEGQATLGHYWAFVADHKSQTWKKFNDVQVTEVDWDELERDCYGGYQNTSAYCLIYVDAENVDLINETSFLPNVDELLETLPEDLKQYVYNDNALFSAEIINWDERHQQAAAASHTTAASATASAATKTNNARQQQQKDDVISAEVMTENFDVAKSYAQEIIKNYVTKKSNGEVSNFDTVIQSEINELKTQWNDFQSSGDLMKDPRLPNMAAYAVAWLVPLDDEKIIGKILFDMFSNYVLSSSNAGQRPSLTAELEQLTPNYELNEEENKMYQAIHRDFNLFCKSVLLISCGIDLYHNKKNYTEALKYFMVAEEYTNSLLGQHHSHPNRAVDWHLLTSYKRDVVTKLSTEMFDSYRAAGAEDDVNKYCANMMSLVLPVLNVLVQDNASGGLKTAQDIKELWLPLLNDVHRRKFGNDTEKRLHDLTEALNCLGSLKMLYPQMTARIKITNDVPQRYNKALQIALGARMF